MDKASSGWALLLLEEFIVAHYWISVLQGSTTPWLPWVWAEAECQRRQPSGSSAVARPSGWTHSLWLKAGLKLFLLMEDGPLVHRLSWRASARRRPNVLQLNLIWKMFAITWLIAALSSQSAGSHLRSTAPLELQVTQQHSDMTHCNGQGEERSPWLETVQSQHVNVMVLKEESIRKDSWAWTRQ